MKLYWKNEARWKAHDEDMNAWLGDSIQIKKRMRQLRKQIKESEQRLDAIEKYWIELRKSA